MSERLTRAKPTAEELARYEPERGLKTIAVFEAAETHFARAKDASQLEKAIRGKLEAQQAFVHWWDHAVQKGQGARTDRLRSRPATKLNAGKNGIPDRYIIDRWRQKLATDETFEATYLAACRRYVKILEEFEAGAHVGQNSGENEWYTPAEIIEAARPALGVIDLNPASTAQANEIVQATTFYTLEQNGLAQPWHGRVWMNPQYAHPLIAQFCEKLAASVTAQAVTAAIVLVNNASDTAWFVSLERLASGLCLLEGRVRFWSPARESATPLQGQAVLYIGPEVERFDERFGAFGPVWRKRR